MTYKTRETWLWTAAALMGKWFQSVEGAREIPGFRVACGWPKRSPAGSIGWCWHKQCSADGTNEIQISPELDDPIMVLQTLLHEMVHASDNGESKHSGYFKKVATGLGLEGPMTATTAGEELRVKLGKLAKRLGPYPHAALRPGSGGRPGAPPKPGEPESGPGRIGKQGTRMLKLSCPADGYTVRTTRKWIDVGLPSCPCGRGLEEVA